MTLATSEPPLRPVTRMTEEEAIEITDAIKGNIDSLGKMLIEMQERKGYLALGYKTLEQYAASEFGKSKSRVYQAIQEFKIEEEIVQELAAENSQIKSLKMPGTHLRMLKDLPSEKKVEAIKYANLLAEQEGKKRASKLHLQVATLKFGGQKPEHLRKSIEDMGFAKGVEVELTQGFGKGDRGVIRKSDKKGQIYVEMHKGTSVPQPWDIERLRIVPESEKPQIPASAHTAKIGDKVKIYSSHRLRGKTGEIVARINEKIAAVKAEGELGITEIPYAEIEVIEEVIETVTGTDWNKHSIWNEGNTTWAYNTSKREIRQLRCPEVCFQPSEIGQFNSFKNPSDWLTNWKEEYGVQLATHLLDTDQIATLVATVAIGMNHEDKKSFIHRINALLTNDDKYAEFVTVNADSTSLLMDSQKTIEKPESMTGLQSAIDTILEKGGFQAVSIGDRIETEIPGRRALVKTGEYSFVLTDCLEKTLESEKTPESVVINAVSTASDREPERTGDFVTANSTENSIEKTVNPPDLPEPTDWRTLLNNFGFIAIGDDDLDYDSIARDGEYRGWTIFTERKRVINLGHPEKGLFSRYGVEELDWEWMKDIINKVEDCPGQLNLFEFDFAKDSQQPDERIEEIAKLNWQKDWIDNNLPTLPEPTYSRTQGLLIEKIEEKLNTLFSKVDALSKSLSSSRLKRAERASKEKEIKSARESIKNLEFFKTFQIGKLVTHQRDTTKIGVVTDLALSNLIPNAFVKWEEDREATPESIHLLSFQNKGET